MRGVTFPFQVVDGRVQTAEGCDTLKEHMKRAIHYVTRDVAYSPEVGSGVGDAVFAPDLSKGVQTFLRSQVAEAVLSIDGISKVNVVPRKIPNGLEITVFYYVDGEEAMQEYTFHSSE